MQRVRSPEHQNLHARVTLETITEISPTVNAMEEPHPGQDELLITIAPTPDKYAIGQ